MAKHRGAPGARLHAEVTRRYFLGFGAAGAAAIAAWPDAVRAGINSGAGEEALKEAIAQMRYLTPLDEFKMFGRGDPPPHTLPPEKLREAGLTRETWRLEIVGEAENGEAELGRPMTREQGTALDWERLMRLAERHAVRFLHVMTCTNGQAPCGMGLWEGVPLRTVLWMTEPKGRFRRIYYFGYHNNDPKQLFQSSLPLGRVLEDPPGLPPIILCYKLNGQWLTPKAGAPVRLMVPGLYGNRSVKWLQRIVLTTKYQTYDTYAEWGNDVESRLKTFARFVYWPRRAQAGRPLALTGVAQVGVSGLRQVQYWAAPAGESWPDDDPYFTKAPWRDADILPPPQHWGDMLPDGRLPPDVVQIDRRSGKPRQWPLPNTLVHWAALAPGLPPGRYQLRCRTIDARGRAQPMPRPLPKSGKNQIQSVPLVVEA